MIAFPSIRAAMAYWSKKIKPAAASFLLDDDHKSFAVAFYADPHPMWGGARLAYWTRTVTVPRRIHA